MRQWLNGKKQTKWGWLSNNKTQTEKAMQIWKQIIGNRFKKDPSLFKDRTRWPVNNGKSTQLGALSDKGNNHS
jgi:hypothetical protein